MFQLSFYHVFYGALFCTIVIGFSGLIGCAGVNSGWFTVTYDQPFHFRDAMVLQRVWYLGTLKYNSTYPQHLLPSTIEHLPDDLDGAGLFALVACVFLTILGLLSAVVLFLSFNPPLDRAPLPQEHPVYPKMVLGFMVAAIFCALLAFFVFLGQVNGFFVPSDEMQNIQISLSWASSFVIVAMVFSLLATLFQSLRIWYLPKSLMLRYGSSPSDIEDAVALNTEEDADDQPILDQE